MSTTVDSRVVEMRFDNKQFESNVQTSMSTLQKLKQSLNLTGASKGLENINTAVKNTNISSLGTAAETVGFKFNALWTIADQTLRNITNSVERTATNMAKALTLDPIKTGLSEYETKINAIQVIQANTRGKNNMNDITNALDDLNTYADKTIYNFAQMTSNIGKFTAQGLDVYQAADAVKGMANLAAASGASAEDMSRATYQMSQALGGTIKLMDWNSLRNANMATVELKNTLIDLAKVNDIAIDDMIEKHGSFEQTLSEGWLSGEMFSQAMNIYSGVYSEAELASMGFTESQIANFMDLAAMAESAATEVKTFTQLWDVLKETAQSGWTQTWELLIGDFETAKNMWTNLQVYFSDIINGWSDARNNLLKGALDNPFKGLIDKINKVTSGVDKVKGATEAVTKATKDYEEIVNKVLGGEYGNGQSRWDKLTEEGYDWAKVQNMVNEKMGDSTRYTEKMTESQKELSKTQEVTIDDLAKMSDAQLKQIGFTDKEIEAFKVLKEQSEKTGLSMEEIIENTDALSGRSLLLNSFKNIWDGLVTVLSSVKDAFRDIFPPMTSEQLYNIIAGLHKLSTYLVVSDETAGKLKRTFKGVFAILDIVSTVLGGGVKIAFKALSAILGAFDMNILDLTANIGDLIVKFRDWLFTNNKFSKFIAELIGKLPIVVAKIKDWFKSFKETSAVQKIIDTFEKLIDYFGKLKGLDFKSIDFGAVFADIKNILSPLIGEMVEIGSNIIEGLQNGIGSKIGDIAGKIREIATTIITTFCELLGIHSPSTVAFEWGRNIIEGLVNGISSFVHLIADGLVGLGHGVFDAFSGIIEFIKYYLGKFVDFVMEFDWSKLIPLIPITAILIIVKKIVDIATALGDGVNAINDVVEGFADLQKKFGKVLDAFKTNIKANALKKIAVSIAILVGSIAVLTMLDPEKMYDAVAVVVILSGVLIGLTWAMDKLSSASVGIGDGKLNVEGIKTGILAIGASLLLIAAAVRLLGGMDPTQFQQAFEGLAYVVSSLLIVFIAYGMLAKFGGGTSDIDKVGSMMFKLSISLLLIAGVAKIAGTMTKDELTNGAMVLGAFVVFVGILVNITGLAGDKIDKVGGMVLKISFALLILVGVCKLAGLLDANDIIPAILFAGGFLAFVAVLTKVTQIGKDKEIAKLGGLLFSISFSLLLMIGVCKLAAKLSLKEVIAGAGFMLGFIALVKLLVNVATIGNEQKMAKVAGTILAMSVAIGILAGVSIMMSMLSVEGILKGVGAVVALGLVMAAMIWATKGSEKVVGNIVAMAIAVAVMTAAVAALSYVDGDKLKGATTALTMIMGMFAVIALAAGTMGKAMGALVVMTLAVGALAGILHLMTKYTDVDAALSIAKSLSGLLLSLSAACVLLGVAGALGPGVFLGIAALLVLVVGVGTLIAAIGALVQDFPQLEAFLDTGIPILEKIGYGLGSFISSIGEGLTSGLPDMAQNISDFMGKLKTAADNASGIKADSFDGVSELFGVMGEIAKTTVGTTISDIFTLGGTSMDKFQSDGVAFFGAMKEIAVASSGITLDENSISAVISVAEKLSELQSSLTGMDGVLTWFIQHEDLKSFGSNAADFFSSMKTGLGALDGFTVNSEALTSVMDAANQLSTLQSSLTGMDGVLTWFIQHEDLKSFGNNASDFFGSMKTGLSALDGITINSESLTAVMDAATQLAGLQESLTGMSGVLTWFIQHEDLSTFGANISDFFGSMKDAAMSLGDTVINAEAFSSVMTAADRLADLEERLSNMGSVIDWFKKQDDLSSFGTNIGYFADGIGKLKDVAGENGISTEAVTSITNAGDAIIALNDTLPEEGFFDKKITMSTFSEYIKDFATALSDFSSTASTLNADGIGVAMQAAYRIRNLINTIADLDVSGVSTFTGVGSGGVGADGPISDIADAMADFSSKVAGIDVSAVSTSVSAASRLKTLINSLAGVDASGVENFKIGPIGTAMKSYINSVDDMDTGVVSSSISAANRLKNFINSLADIDTSGIGKFRISSIGSSIKDYALSVAGIDSGAISSSISGANKIKNFINSLAGLDTSGVSSFNSAVSTLGQTNVNGLVSAFSGAASKMSGAGTNIMNSLAKGMKSSTSSLTSAASSSVTSIFNSITSKASMFMVAGKTLMSNLATGISSMRGSISSASASAASSGASGIRGYWSSFYSAGSYLVSGFCSGISANTFRAAAQARAMANAAEQAAKAALKINSPSKVFAALGSGVVEGFVKGIDDNLLDTTNAVHSMADTAIQGFSGSMQVINDVLNSDIDSQPTIRPVVDLSEVSYGANAINDMLAMGSYIGVRTNVGAISAAMNRNSQNGANSEIVSAIDKLRKDLGNVGNTYNNINGVTYDDGSNITDAVQTLVRAAKVERRR